MYLELNDNNSTYLGDGAYGHIDSYKRLWVVAYNGISVTEQVCLEEGAINSLISLQNRILGTNYILTDRENLDEQNEY